MTKFTKKVIWFCHRGLAVFQLKRIQTLLLIERIQNMRLTYPMYSHMSVFGGILKTDHIPLIVSEIHTRWRLITVRISC